jgi:hypothetical protein
MLGMNTSRKTGIGQAGCCKQSLTIEAEGVTTNLRYIQAQALDVIVKTSTTPNTTKARVLQPLACQCEPHMDTSTLAIPLKGVPATLHT